jgi:aminopeptidase YwaD
VTRFDDRRAYEFMTRLSFTRPGGTAEEARAAEEIAAQLRAAGLAPRIETFEVWTYEEEPSSVTVLSPGRATFKAAPVGLTGNTEPDGATAELVFVETGEEEFLHGIRGKIALTYGSLGAKKYERLARAGAKAVIAIGDPGRDLLHLSIYDHYFRRWGKLPTVFITYEDGLQLIRSGAREVRIVCRQRELQAESRNVLVEIPGRGFGTTTGAPESCRKAEAAPAKAGPAASDDDFILLCGHYDSVPCTTGAHDNAGGAAILVELARNLAAHPPRRAVRVAWFGSEELGLHGSAAYAANQMASRAAQKGDLDHIRLVVNVDVAGGTIGRNHCTVTGPESLRSYLDILGKEIGAGLETKLGIMSSDGVPFGDKGVPSVNFARHGGATANLHTSYDALEHTDAYHLGLLGRLVEIFVERAANSMAFPFEREIPEKVKKDIAKYCEESMGLEKQDAGDPKVRPG